MKLAEVGEEEEREFIKLEQNEDMLAIMEEEAQAALTSL